jgi:predicted dinucleotide-binding enzyme
MKIAIIGPGNVGTALGEGFAKHGHEVAYGARDVAKHPESKPIQEAAGWAEVVVLAVPWEAAKNAIDEAGGLAGKIVIDATNPLKPQLAGLELGTETSAGEMVQEWAPEARVVKAFNTIGFNIMEDSSFPDGNPVLFYCGNDSGARKVVDQLAGELGFEPQDLGSIEQCRLMEPFALLWITLAYKAGLGREFAFRLIKR